MAHIFRKRMALLQAGLLMIAAVFSFSVISGNVTSMAQTTLITPTPLGGGRGEIGFATNRDGKSELFVMNADGSNIRRLFSETLVVGNPVWSWDGGQIAYTSLQDNQSDIYVMNADGSDIRRLTENSAYDQHPAWSPDGQQIAFDSSQNNGKAIYLMNADGTNLHKLTDIASYASFPTWSPDGTQIAFVSSPTHATHEIDIMNIDGSNVHRLTDFYNENLYTFPAWSPDGRQIAFVGTYVNDEGEGHQVAIYSISADGSNFRHIFTSVQDVFYPVAWSPDSTQIVFVLGEHPDSDIYVMNVDGSNIRRLTNDAAYDNYPAWLR